MTVVREFPTVTVQPHDAPPGAQRRRINQSYLTAAHMLLGLLPPVIPSMDWLLDNLKVIDNWLGEPETRISYKRGSIPNIGVTLWTEGEPYPTVYLMACLSRTNGTTSVTLYVRHGSGVRAPNWVVKAGDEVICLERQLIRPGRGRQHAPWTTDALFNSTQREALGILGLYLMGTLQGTIVDVD